MGMVIVLHINKTGTHFFWENGVDYPRVSPGAHPLAKKPEDSGYEIGVKLSKIF